MFDEAPRRPWSCKGTTIPICGQKSRCANGQAGRLAERGDRPRRRLRLEGEKFYEQRPTTTASRGSTEVSRPYQAIDIQVKEKRLTYRAFDRDGQEVDCPLVIEKRKQPPRLAGASR